MPSAAVGCCNAIPASGAFLTEFLLRSFLRRLHRSGRVRRLCGSLGHHHDHRPDCSKVNIDETLLLASLTRLLDRSIDRSMHRFITLSNQAIRNVVVVLVDFIECIHSSGKR